MKIANTRSVVAVSSLTIAMFSVGALQAADLNSTFGLDANIEIDTDAIDYSAGSTEYRQGGRVEANLRGEVKSERFFVRGKGTLILAKNSDTHTDDVWVQFGQEWWDLQFGRFEAVNLFPKGKDTLAENAGSGETRVYEANLARGRAGNDGGQMALHLKADNGFNFELATLFGDANEDGSDEDAFTGVRPVITYTNERFSAWAGYEYLNRDLKAGGEDKKEGVGIGASFGLGDAQVSLSGAWLDEQTTNTDVASYNANVVYGQFGAGIIYSKTELASGNEPEVTTGYLAYTLPLLDIDNATVTFAASHSKADNVTSAVSDEVTGARLRINYTF